MAKFVFPTGEWAEAIAKDYDIAARSLPRVIAQSVYKGADILANAGRAAAEAHGLAQGFGIAPFRQDSDGAQTSIGFNKKGADGYFVNRWGETVPYALAVNVLEYGSSRVQATHFMSSAFKKARPAAEAAMRQVFENEMNKLLK